MSNQKQKYLQRENRRQREEISDLRELIQMNKIEIDVLSRSGGSHNHKLTAVMANYRTIQTKHMQRILELEQQVSELHLEVLMLRQLNDELNAEQRNLQQLQHDALREMQARVFGLENKLVQYERSLKIYDNITGFVERNRDIYNPTEQALDFLQKEAQLNRQIALLRTSLTLDKENQEALVKANGILRHKVVTLQAKLAMPNRNTGEILQNSVKRLMMYFVETQKRLLAGDQSDSDRQEDLELIAPELSGLFGDRAIRKQDTRGVPAIDLLKVRAVMNTNGVKIHEEIVKRNLHMTKEDKIKGLEAELEYTRRELTKNLIDLREERERRKILEVICDEMEGRNQVLCASNKRYQRQVGVLLKRIRNERSIEDKENVEINKLDKRADGERMRVEAVKRKEIDGLAVPEEGNILEYRIHLQLLAKELDRNVKLAKLAKMHNGTSADHKVNGHQESRNDLGEQWRPRLKRSTSNPFLYFNERRKDIMEVKYEEDSSQMRLEQTLCLPRNMGERIHNQNLDDIVV